MSTNSQIPVQVIQNIADQYKIPPQQTYQIIHDVLSSGRIVAVTPPPYAAIEDLKSYTDSLPPNKGANLKQIVNWLDENNFFQKSSISNFSTINDPPTYNPVQDVLNYVASKKPFGVSFCGEIVELDYARVVTDKYRRSLIAHTTGMGSNKQEIKELKNNIKIPLDRIKKSWVLNKTIPWGKLDQVEVTFLTDEYSPHPNDSMVEDMGSKYVVTRKVEYSIPFLTQIKSMPVQILAPDSLIEKAKKMMSRTKNHIKA